MIEDAKSCAMHWYSRVSSEGNPGDGPSRMDSILMQKLGAKRVRVELWTYQHLSGDEVMAELREVSRPTECGLRRVVLQPSQVA